LQEAAFYVEEENGFRCTLCPHFCTLDAGAGGKCGVRKNIGGRLIALNYGKIAALALDPIEKKPLYHFFPGSSILSAGTIGCNFGCDFCQNWQLARGKAPTQDISPWDLISRAQKPDNTGLAFTYAEPLMWYEFIREVLPLLREKGLKTVLVTNAYLNPEPLQELLPYIDAVNIDIKTFSTGTYHRFCSGDLNRVLQNTLLFKRHCHVEITTLIIPGINENIAEIGRLVDWIKDELGRETPLHLSRYFPAYRMQNPPPTLEHLVDLYEMAREKLPYVYLGNITDARYRHTYCPQCDYPVIKRDFAVDIQLSAGNTCPRCGQFINITN